MKSILEVRDVYKKLGKREIIKGISFTIKEGEIFGFLGPNGAGKTTTIRMLVGLIAPNSGSIIINGYNIENNRENALSHVGTVVENPELYTYLTGRENLMQIARIRKIDKDEIEEIIELVGLKDRINDKVKKYSLGMKQRLGLAAALMSKPKLLILDEPTNGLDPSGILDFRNIVRKAAKERNTSVFVSSHILSEVEQICDRVAFINNGIIKSVESIKGHEGNEELDTIEVKSFEIQKCAEVLKSLSFVNNIQTSGNSIQATVIKGRLPDIIFALANSQIRIEEIFKKQVGLEERYMELVEGGRRNA